MLGQRAPSTKETAPKDKPAKKIAKYSWLDEDAKVKYVKRILIIILIESISRLTSSN